MLTSDLQEEKQQRLKFKKKIFHFRYAYEDVERIAKSVLDRVKCRPHIGIICGSGLGGLAEMLDDKEIIQYEDVEGFPVSTGMVILICCRAITQLYNYIYDNLVKI